MFPLCAFKEASLNVSKLNSRLEFVRVAFALPALPLMIVVSFLPPEIFIPYSVEDKIFPSM